MAREILIIQKEEAYTYDELEWLEEKLLYLISDKKQKTSASRLLKNLKASLENQKTSKAIFFMPQNTFNIFSMIQGDNSICKIQKEDIEALYKAFDFLKENIDQPIYTHLHKKLEVLNTYLQQGNNVTPTVITADNFSKIQL